MLLMRRTLLILNGAALSFYVFALAQSQGDGDSWWVKAATIFSAIAAAGTLILIVGGSKRWLRRRARSRAAKWRIARQ